MNLGTELRNFRSRTGMKQEAVADLLRISQAYVSRLESGTTEPNEELERRILLLLNDPTHLGVLSFVLSSVRQSPHIACVLKPVPESVRYVALSEGFRSHPQFSSIEEGDDVRSEAHANGEGLIRQLLISGAFSGRVESMDALWCAQIAGYTNYWHAINTPIRDDEGLWFLHCAMTQMDADEFARREAARAEPILIKYFPGREDG